MTPTQDQDITGQVKALRDALTQGLFVVELEDGQAYLGEVELSDDEVTVYTGFVGRPPVLPRDEVVAIIPAAEHPDVVLELELVMQRDEED